MNYSRVFGVFANRSVISVIASVVLSVLLIAAIVEASTTISTNVSTDGNLTVTGTASVTGLTTLVFASSTTQSLTGNLLVNGYATTTGSSGNFATAGTLTVGGTASVTGLTTLVFASSTTQSLIGNLLVNGYATTTGLSGNFATEGTLTVGTNGVGTDVTFYTDSAGEELLWDASENQLVLDGADGTTAFSITDGNFQVTDHSTLASTTATSFKVGQVGSQHSVILSGTCNILADSSITASTTGYADCVAAGVVAADKVFFTLATTSPFGTVYGYQVRGANASSTTGYITFSITNFTGANGIPGATALFGSSTQYWVVR